jgi:hypothetical protein
MSPIYRGSAARRAALRSRRRPATKAPTRRLSEMRWSTRVASFAIFGVLVTLSVAACGGSGVNAQAGPTPSTSTVAPTPSHTPAPPTKSELAGAAASAQVVKYERLLDALSIHPRMSLDRLYTVSTEPDVTEEISSLNQFREARDRQVGTSQVEGTRVDHVSLTDHRAGRHPAYPTVHITTCVDVRRVRGFGPNGKSIVPKGRKAYLFTHLTLVNTKYPDTSNWLVSKVTDKETSACPA